MHPSKTRSQHHNDFCRLNKERQLFVVVAIVVFDADYQSVSMEVVKRLQIIAPTDPKPKKGSSVVNVTNMEQFKRLTSAPTLSVVHFWASWANQVRKVYFIIEKNDLEFLPTFKFRCLCS